MSTRVVHHVAFQLPVLFLKERRAYIAYTPALDFSASGSSPSRAKKNFEIALRLFVEELLERGTFEQVLKDMGWSRQEHRWQPPIELQRTGTVPFRMPVPA